MTNPPTVSPRAFVVTAAGVAVNLCLGILYAWSVWQKALTNEAVVTAAANTGWGLLSNAKATLAYTVCGITFAVFMIPGGRLQDRYGPRAGAVLAGLFLGAGCALAGLLRSSEGLVLGFGLLGGIGMGLGYAAATPAAVKWFGPHRRGLVVGLVVGGYGGAALYIAPLATALIADYGITGSFVGLGGLFAAVVVGFGLLLAPPPAGYVPPAPLGSRTAPSAAVDLPPRVMLGTWQFYALVFMMFGSAQSGLLVIANAAPLLTKTAAKSVPFFAENAWLLAAFGGLVNAAGRVGTGLYSDAIGRTTAFALNGVVSTACLVATPAVIAAENVPLLFLVVGVTLWQYGGTLSLLPALTADFYGPKNLGLNYGLVFLGWGAAFLIALAAAVIKDVNKSIDPAFYLSAFLLAAAVVTSRFVKRPTVA